MRYTLDTLRLPIKLMLRKWRAIRFPRVVSSYISRFRKLRWGEFSTSRLEDSCRSPSSLRSDLELARALLKLSKRCLCPTLKSHARALHTRKVELAHELKIRSEEKKLLV